MSETFAGRPTLIICQASISLPLPQSASVSGSPSPHLRKHCSHGHDNIAVRSAVQDSAQNAQPKTVNVNCVNANQNPTQAYAQEREQATSMAAVVNVVAAYYRHEHIGDREGSDQSSIHRVRDVQVLVLQQENLH